MFLGELDMPDEIREELNNIKVTASMLGYIVEYELFDASCLMKIIGKHKTYKITLHLTQNKVYGLWITATGGMFRCSSEQDFNKDMLLPLKLISTILQYS